MIESTPQQNEKPKWIYRRGGNRDDTPPVLNHNVSALEEAIGHTFLNRGFPYLLLADTVANNVKGRLDVPRVGTTVSEFARKLEIVGDGLLLVLAAEWVSKTPAGLDEGEAARVMQTVKSNETLKCVASRLDVPELMRISPRRKENADWVERLLGAVHQDAGFDTARSVARRLYASVTSRWTDDGQSIHRNGEIASPCRRLIGEALTALACRSRFLTAEPVASHSGYVAACAKAFEKVPKAIPPVLVERGIELPHVDDPKRAAALGIEILFSREGYSGVEGAVVECLGLRVVA